ncbi:MAG: oligosaccharide flippase family protein [Methylobacterium mesophilicum]|nr:oligosaccharide flippase family protein [Methylobacterium mesophilicum]
MRFSAAGTADRFLPAPLAARARPHLGRLDALLFAADERGAASRMSLLAFSIRILSALIGFVGQVLLARWMGGFEYGIFVLVWLVMVIAGSLSCLGFHTSVVRFVPEYRERGMLPELRGILWGSRVFTLLASTALAVLGVLGLWLARDLVEPYYLAPFVLGLVAMPMIALSDTLQGISRARSWGIAALAPTYLIRPVLILLLMVGLIAAGFTPDAVTATLAAVLATYLTTLGHLLVVSGRVSRETEKGPSRFLVRHWLAVSLPIFLVESFFFLLTNADVLMVGAYMKPDDVGVYFATVKVLALVHFVYFAVKAGVAQRYAQFTHADPARLAQFARETVSWTFWPSLFMALVVLTLGEPLLMLFGPGFEAGFWLLVPLLFGVVIRAAIGPAESLLTMSGHQNACALVFALTLVFNITLCTLLIPRFGLWGAAFSTAFSILFEAIALGFTVWRKHGFVMFILAPQARAEAL